MRLLQLSRPTRYDDDAFVFFRRFVAVKVGTPWILPRGLYHPPELSWVSLGVLLAVIAACTRRYFWPGLLVLFGSACLHIWTTWPFTLNHAVLEAVVVLLLLLDTGEPVFAPRMTTLELIKGLMISVWIYSGVQKLAHGYFSTGESLALAALSGESTIGRHLAGALQFVAPPFGPGVGAPLHCCTNGAIALPGWAALTFQTLGVATIVTELVLPLALLLPQCRKVALALLVGFQVTTGLVSGEIDFTFTALAMLVLFIPEHALLSYSILVVGYLFSSAWA